MENEMGESSFTHCRRCHGLMIDNGDDLYCINCGYRPLHELSIPRRPRLIQTRRNPIDVDATLWTLNKQKKAKGWKTRYKGLI